MRFILAFLMALPFAAHRGAAAAPVTFNKHIAPIIYRNCSSCHRPGEAAPFPLLSYQDVVKKGKMIGKVTAAHDMPPWKAEPASYAYRDERRLKAEEIALIQAWLQAGMPEGNAADRLEPPKFASGWQLGEPDLVVEMPAAYHVPADGPDIYRNIAVPLPKGTRLDSEIHWDNSAANPRNPSSPPVRVTWGEESKDEMGSISLIAVAHEESERALLQRDYRPAPKAVRAKTDGGGSGTGKEDSAVAR